MPTWPDVVRRVARHGLPGIATHDCPAQPLGAAEWQQLIAAVRRERLSGLLLAAIEDGGLLVSGDQRAEASALHRAASYLNLALEGVTVEVVNVFVDARIDYRVIKGPTLAQLEYPHPEQRSFVDVDVLVRSEQFDSAIEALTEAGYARDTPQPRRGFDRRFGKGAMLATPKGFTLDVHRTFDRGPFGLHIDLDDLWAEPVEFWLAGTPMLALPPELRFLNVCFHAALGDLPPRLAPLRDVAQLALNGGRSLDRSLALAEAWRGRAVVARAVELAWHALELPPDAPIAAWAASYEPTRWEARMLALYLDPGRSQMSRVIAMLGTIRGIAPRLAYVRAIAFPDADYLADRDRGHLDHWRLGTRPWRRRPDTTVGSTPT